MGYAIDLEVGCKIRISYYQHPNNPLVGKVGVITAIDEDGYIYGTWGDEKIDPYDEFSYTMLEKAPVAG